MSLLPNFHWFFAYFIHLHNYTVASVELFKFYFNYLPIFTKLFGSVNFPKFLRLKQSRNSKNWRLSVAKSLIRDYNSALFHLKEKLNEIFAEEHEIEFQTRMSLVFIVRLCLIFAAYQKANLSTIILINSMQFFVAPFSLFVSTVYFFCYLLPMVLPHLLVNATLKISLNLICPSVINSLSIPISTIFITVFLLIDQLICLIMSLNGTPKLKCQKFPLREFITHMWFGNLNCKTYFLVLFFALNNYSFSVNTVALLVDWYFNLTEKISYMISKQTRLDSSCLFYHMHRIAHLPRVYQHAHKLHHHLQGSNAFDAHHLYGSGLPEEWVELSFELLLSLKLGLNPLVFNPVILIGSWENKIDHMKKLDGGNNHHAYHHILHSKNFSNFGGLLDLVFDTHSKDDEIDLDGYLMKRSETEETVEISFALVDS